MNPKDNIVNDSNFQKLLHNDSYYQHIFKKTEKIVSVVFYILNNIDIDKKSETQVSNLASKAHLVHEHALRSLEVRQSSAQEVLEQFAQALIALDSTLRIALTTNLVSAETLQVVSNEIDAVLRGLNSYMEVRSFTFSIATPASVASTTTSRTESSSAGKRSSVGGLKAGGSSGGGDRQERIKTILEAKGEATIKDISEIVTDCSEKTIQRELNDMIAKNVVKRQGERRWSKYSVL